MCNGHCDQPAKVVVFFTPLQLGVLIAHPISRFVKKLNNEVRAKRSTGDTCGFCQIQAARRHCGRHAITIPAALADIHPYRALGDEFAFECRLGERVFDLRRDRTRYNGREPGTAWLKGIQVKF